MIPHSPSAQQLHAHGGRSDLTLNQRMAAGTFDEASGVELELQPGQMSMPASSVFERDPRPARKDFEVGHRRAAAS